MEREETEQKLCTMCQSYKGWSQFNNQSKNTKRDGLAYYCKDCNRKRNACKRKKWTRHVQDKWHWEDISMNKCHYCEYTLKKNKRFNIARHMFCKHECTIIDVDGMEKDFRTQVCTLCQKKVLGKKELAQHVATKHGIKLSID